MVPSGEVSNVVVPLACLIFHHLWATALYGNETSVAGWNTEIRYSCMTRAPFAHIICRRSQFTPSDRLFWTNSIASVVPFPTFGTVSTRR